jgi:hypothetical protein
MARGSSYDVFKRDTLVLNFLREHKGEENKVTSYDVKTFLEENGYPIKRNNVGTLINKIMYDRNAPICFSNVKGYYWATTREELEKTIADLESRRNALQEHIDHLKGFMI